MGLSTIIAQTILITPTSVTNFVSAVAVVALGTFIFLRDRKDDANQIAFAMSLFLGFWAMSSTLADVMHEPAPALFWARAGIIGPYFYPAFFLVFSHYFPYESGRMTWWKAVLIFLPAFIVLTLVPTELNIVSVMLADWGTDFVPGPLFPIGILYQILYVILAVINFVRAKKGTRNVVVRKQIDLVIFTIVIVTTAQFTINALLPVAFGYTQATVFGPASSALFVLFLSYAIFRHGLLDIKIIATETLALILIFISIVQLFGGSSIPEFISRFVVLLVTVVTGLMLIRAVRGEVRRREEVQRLAEKLQAANRELRKLDDLKSTMVSIASHQLRGPLGGMRGYFTMFRDGDLGPLTDKQKEIVKMNLNTLSRLLNAVETFLDITKLEAGKMVLRKEVLPLDEAVREVAHEFEIMLKKKGLELRTDIQKDVWVNFDPEKIKHVVFNLVDNSMKYTERGWVSVSLRTEGSEAVIEVADSGKGIPAEDLPRLFGKFERGELVIDRGGSGLGLYVVKMLAEMQGGEVSVSSAGIGKGSSFVVRLPLAPAP